MTLTLSTSLKTRKKLSPANFFKSSMVHIPLASNVENNSGYLETSSKPTGALVKECVFQKILLVVIQTDMVY